jgi:hypothetical protein
MILRVLIVVAIGLNFTFAAKADEWEGLILKGDYKNLPVYVRMIKDGPISYDEVYNAIKLRLLANNIKPSKWNVESPHCLYANVFLGEEVNAFHINLYLQKRSSIYAKPQLIGPLFKPWQGTYSILGTGQSKTLIKEGLNDCLDAFLLDYIESNMAYLEDVQELKKYTDRLKNERKSNILQNIDSFLDKAEAGDPHALIEIRWLGKNYPEETMLTKEDLKQLESENKTNDKSSE